MQISHPAFGQCAFQGPAERLAQRTVQVKNRAVGIVHAHEITGRLDNAFETLVSFVVRPQGARLRSWWARGHEVTREKVCHEFRAQTRSGSSLQDTRVIWLFPLYCSCGRNNS